MITAAKKRLSTTGCRKLNGHGRKLNDHELRVTNYERKRNHNKI